MNRYSLIIAALFLIPVLAAGQLCNDHCKKKEQIKAQKVAFITEKLNLTVDEAQKFWPVYNEMAAKTEELEKKRRSIVQNYHKNKQSLTSEQMEALTDKMLKLEIMSVKLEVEYYRKFKEILSPEKIIELKISEHQFKHELLKQLKGCEAAGREQ